MDATQPVHPYYPAQVEIPGYVANTLSTPELLFYFGGGWGALIIVGYVLLQKIKPDLRTGEFATAVWFFFCGFMHLFFEGYYAYNFQEMASKTDLFGQLWKEYSLSDSRYLTQDSFLVPMESVTAFLWGPISFFIAYAIVTNHPLRHPLQLLVSAGQFYGDVLYYATSTFTLLVHKQEFCRPENYYFWAYYFLCNSFWIVIPGILAWKSICATSKVFAQVQKLETSKKGR